LKHVSGRDGECDCNVLLDQDAADAHLATDPVDRLVHTLDDERRKTERRLVSRRQGCLSWHDARTAPFPSGHEPLKRRFEREAKGETS